MTPAPVDVELTIADSKRAPAPARLEVIGFTLAQRLTRTFSRGGLSLIIGCVLLVLPALHLCGAIVLLFGVPTVFVLTWRSSVRLVSAQQIACPKCEAQVGVEPESLGWPMFANCQTCSARVEINARKPADPPAH